MFVKKTCENLRGWLRFPVSALILKSHFLGTATQGLASVAAFTFWLELLKILGWQQQPCRSKPKPRLNFFLWFPQIAGENGDFLSVIFIGDMAVQLSNLFMWHQWMALRFCTKTFISSEEMYFFGVLTSNFDAWQSNFIVEPEILFWTAVSQSVSAARRRLFCQGLYS